MKTKLQQRLQRVLPHTVALLTGAGVFQARTILLGNESGLLWVSYFVALMAAPFIGAWGVLLLHDQMSRADSRRVLSPYLWWGGSGAVALVLLQVLTRAGVASDGFIPRSTTGEQLFSDFTFLGSVIVVVLVPIVVPSLRMIMWLVSPPTSTAELTEASGSRDH